MTNTRTHTSREHPDRSDGTVLEELQVAIGAKLTKLAGYLPYIDDLTEAAQHELPFQSPAAQAAAARAAEIEADADRMDFEVRPGRQWERPERRIVGVGNTRTPVASLSALTLSADIAVMLHGLVRRIVTALNAAGVCPIARLAPEPTAEQLIAHLRELRWAAPSPSLLRTVDGELTTLVDAADRFVHGDAMRLLPDPCPHCGNYSLIAYFRDDVIRCDRNSRSRQRALEPCVCDNEICQCKTTPVSFRHEWIRNPPSAPNSWAKLSGRLDRNRPDRRHKFLHVEPHPQRGEMVRVRYATIDGKHTITTTLLVDDWWDRYSKSPLVESHPKTVALQYAFRALVNRLPFDDQLIHGRLDGGAKALVHVTEILPPEPEPADDPEPGAAAELESQMADAATAADQLKSALDTTFHDETPDPSPSEEPS